MDSAKNSDPNGMNAEKNVAAATATRTPGGPESASVAEKKALFESKTTDENSLVTLNKEEFENEAMEEGDNPQMTENEAMDLLADSDNMSIGINTAEQLALADGQAAKKIPPAKKMELRTSLLKAVEPTISRTESLPGPSNPLPRPKGNAPTNEKNMIALRAIAEAKNDLGFDQDDLIPAGGDAFTGLDDEVSKIGDIMNKTAIGEKKRAREASGDHEQGLNHLELFLETRQEEEKRDPRRLVCFTPNARDFNNLIREFLCDLYELQKDKRYKYTDFLFEREAAWDKKAKVGHIYCDTKSKPEAILQALKDCARKNEVYCQLYRLVDFMAEWTVMLILLNGTPLAKMQKNSEATEYLNANLDEFNGIKRDDWILAAVLQPRQGEIKITEKDSKGNYVPTGRTRFGKIGNTMAVIHLKNAAKLLIDEDQLTFQHGKVGVRWASHDKILMFDYQGVLPDEEGQNEDVNRIPLGARGRGLGSQGQDRPGLADRGRGRGRGGRGGQGGRGRAGDWQPPATTANQTKPPPKKQRTDADTTGETGDEVRVISGTPLGKKVIQDLEASNKTGELQVIVPIPLGKPRFWREVATEYQDYCDTFRDKMVPELNEHIRVYKQLNEDSYEGPEMSLAGATNDTMVTVQGVKTLRNAKKKKMAAMRKCVNAVRNIRQQHLIRLGSLEQELKLANTGGESGYMDALKDLKDEIERTYDTIRDPKKVRMIPHDIV